MRFMLLGYERTGEAVEPAEMERRVRRHQGAIQELAVGTAMERGEPLLVASAGLTAAEEAVTVRVAEDGPRASEGPAAVGSHALAGFDVVELASREAAVDFARRSCDHEGHVSEIRPVRDLWFTRHAGGKSEALPYALLLHADDAAFARLPGEAQAERVRSHQQTGLAYAAQKGLERGEPLTWTGIRLHPSWEGTTLRAGSGEGLVTDGPFAEAREAVGGVILVDCDSREEAIHWAGRMADPEGSAVEVRPVRSFWWIRHG